MMQINTKVEQEHLLVTVSDLQLFSCCQCERIVTVLLAYVSVLLGRFLMHSTNPRRKVDMRGWLMIYLCSTNLYWRSSSFPFKMTTYGQQLTLQQSCKLWWSNYRCRKSRRTIASWYKRIQQWRKNAYSWPTVSDLQRFSRCDCEHSTVRKFPYPQHYSKVSGRPRKLTVI